MSHFALLCPEHAGHLLSNGPVGVELARRGHKVTLISLADAAPIAAQLGLAFHPLDLSRIRFWPPTVTWLAFETVRAGTVAYMRKEFAWKAKGMLELLPQILKDLKIDGLISDHTLPAAGTAAQRAGVPFVTICSALLWHEEIDLPPFFTGWPLVPGAMARWRNRLGWAGWHWYMGPTLRTINRYRRKWGLPPLRRIDDTFSPLAQISQLSEGFDFPRRLPPHFHYIGSLASDRQTGRDIRFPWERLDRRPLIFASLGTVPYHSNVPVFRKIAEACIGVDAQLVLALGQWNEAGAKIKNMLGTLPGDHVVVDFAPQLKLLDRAALLITHAGVNTVLEAICRGVPMVALPRIDDQPGMGSRIAFSRIGLCGSFKHATPLDIRGMVRRVLEDDSFRQRTVALKETMLTAGGAKRAADIAEEALLMRRPVERLGYNNHRSEAQPLR
jgi:UDP:flavonoid glycosyltransferase YjiC (YdhE family)